MIVLKFGGTSVGDPTRVHEAAAIAANQPAPRVVVVSAASGVTNMLLAAARAAADGDQATVADICRQVRAKHDGVADAVSSESDRLLAVAALDQLHAQLQDALAAVSAASVVSARDSDRIVSTGEKSMSVLMAATLRSRGVPAVHVFADQVVATDGRFGNARPDRVRTEQQAAVMVQPHLDEGKTVVMTGFIGGSPEGETTTLGRGGSDYSATLIGAALHADEVQIWTDVPGVLSADPRRIESARVVPQISYDEAQELAHFGAKVLHPRTIRPAVALGIPVRILSTFAPEEPGTLVSRESAGDTVKAVTALKDLLLLTIDVPEMEDLAAASAAVFAILHTERVEIAGVSQASSRRRMTYLVDAGASGGCDVMCARIAAALDAADLEATVACAQDVALVAAVGEGAAAQPSALARTLEVLTRAGVSILSASQQLSNVALTAAVPAQQAERAVTALHDAFIKPAFRQNGRRPRRADLLAESVRVG